MLLMLLERGTGNEGRAIILRWRFARRTVTLEYWDHLLFESVHL